MHLRGLVFAVLSLLAVSTTAGAQPAGLSYNLGVDLTLTAAATAALIGSELAKAELAANTCRLCDDRLNVVDAAFRKTFRWDHSGTASALSSVVAYGLLPAAALALIGAAANASDAWHQLPIDALVIAESVALAASVTQLVKLTSGRERPFVHDLTAEAKASTAQPSDNNTSFYSGHANLAFALAVSVGTIASMRRCRWATWAWGVGLSLATASAYLRVAADKHYLSDVLAAATMGSAIGFVIPFLHRPQAPRLTGSVVAKGAMVSLSWTS